MGPEKVRQIIIVKIERPKIVLSFGCNMGCPYSDLILRCILYLSITASKNIPNQIYVCLSCMSIIIIYTLHWAAFFLSISCSLSLSLSLSIFRYEIYQNKVSWCTEDCDWEKWGNGWERTGRNRVSRGRMRRTNRGK